MVYSTARLPVGVFQPYGFETTPNYVKERQDFKEIEIVLNLSKGWQQATVYLGSDNITVIEEIFLPNLDDPDTI